MYKDGNQFRGVIRVPGEANESYEIATFASGKPMLIKFAENDYECNGFIAEGTSGEKVTGPCNTVVRVLVLYTQKGASAVPNIVNTAKLAVDLLNGAVWNTIKDHSRVSFELAGITSTGTFTETGNDMTLLVNDFANNPWIQYLRNIYMADVVVGLTDVNDPTALLGKTHTIGPWNEQKAYALVDADVANDEFTFSHELGHLMGGRHQQYTVNTDDYDNTAGRDHGYGVFINRLILGQYRYSDIMHVRKKKIQREHVFSHHNLQLHGRTFGDYNTNDVMYTLIDNACTVADNRVDTVVRFLASMNAPASSYTGNTVNVTVTPFNGIPNYTYEWWTSSNGGSSWQKLPNTTSSYSSTISVTMPNAPNLIVSVEATTAASEKQYIRRVIYNHSAPWNNPVTPCCPNYKLSKEENDPAATLSTTDAQKFMAVSPNPANVALEFTINVPENQNEEMILYIYDVYGRKVTEKAVNESTSWNFNCSSLPSGTYFAHLVGKTIREIEKITIQK